MIALHALCEARAQRYGLTGDVRRAAGHGRLGRLLTSGTKQSSMNIRMAVSYCPPEEDRAEPCCEG